MTQAIVIRNGDRMTILYLDSANIRRGSSRANNILATIFGNWDNDVFRDLIQGKRRRMRQYNPSLKDWLRHPVFSVKMIRL